MQEPQKTKLTDNPSTKEPKKIRLEATQLYLFDDFGPILTIDNSNKDNKTNENSEKSNQTEL